MKIAIMSDVHANPLALVAALADAEERGVQKKLLLGDVVGYGYNPSRCINLSKLHFDVVLKGNHDAAVAGELDLSWFNSTAANGVIRSRVLINDKDKEWLKGLPYTYIDDEHHFVTTHGTVFFPERFEYLDNTFVMGLEIESIIKGRLQGAKNCRIIFCGHTHRPTALEFDSNANFVQYLESNWNTKDNDIITLSKDKYYVVNVGSVGYPRAFHCTTYAIYDTDKMTIEMVKIPFDFEHYVSHLESNNIPLPYWLESYIYEEKEDMENGKKM